MRRVREIRLGLLSSLLDILFCCVCVRLDFKVLVCGDNLADEEHE